MNKEGRPDELRDIKQPGKPFKKNNPVQPAKLTAFKPLAREAAPGKISPKLIFLWVTLGALAILGTFFIKTWNDSRKAAEKLAELNIAQGNAAIAEPGWGTFKDLFSVFKNMGGAYTDISRVSNDAIRLVQNIALLQDEGLNYFLNDGTKLLALLSEIKNDLAKVTEFMGDIEKRDNLAEIFDFNDFLPPHPDLVRTGAFLEELISWLGSAEERHLLVLFANTSELRPGSGFIGSYADLAVSGGELKKFEVLDINDPDRLLKQNIIPPRELQFMVSRWRAADSNWFFDFSESAQKTIKLIEESDLYKGKTSFDGVILVSPPVIRDLLSLVGPVDAGGITMNAENFLSEIEEYVISRETDELPEPKKIVADLANAILAKLEGSNDGRKLRDFFISWKEAKDLMVYMKSGNMQNYFEWLGASGRIYDLPADQNGDYLAVVAANIGGSKSDSAMFTNVYLQSQIDISGKIFNNLKIEREHLAGANDPWWKRVVNRSYLMAFVPSDAVFEGAQGGLARTPPYRNFNGYFKDGDIVRLEDSRRNDPAYPGIDMFKESGKNVWGTWSVVPRGSAETVTFDYSKNLLLPPAPGVKYELVLEKQSGLAASYKVEIIAPVGLRFKENRLPVFEFETSDLPARLVLALTFEEAQ